MQLNLYVLSYCYNRYFPDINLMHSANACTKLLSIWNGSAAVTTQEFSLGALPKTIPGSFVILNPPPTTNSSELHVATLCTTLSNETISPSSCLTVKSIVGASFPGGPWVPFCPVGACSPCGPAGLYDQAVLGFRPFVLMLRTNN